MLPVDETYRVLRNLDLAMLHALARSLLSTILPCYETRGRTLRTRKEFAPCHVWGEQVG